MSAVALQSFGFGEHLVRVVERAGSAWFVGNDVCAALELVNTSQSLGRLDDDERGEVHITDPIGREQQTTVISESGVYSLAFTSRKEAAKRFKRWVTSEVLPAIRATGRYVLATPASSTLTDATPDELDVLNRKLQVAREARVVFGLKAARRAWALLGILPDLTTEMEAAAEPVAPLGVLKRLHRSVGAWLEARVEAAPGHRVASQVLYADYLAWAKKEGFSGPDLLCVIGFGKALSNIGIGNTKTGDGGRRERVGLRLVE